MSGDHDADYVLGTHDDEIARLGLQHRVWRSAVLECWLQAGITAGQRVLDVGAGPGYATVDLAEIVGVSGEVLAIERSSRFLEHARYACNLRGLTNVKFREADLMEEEIGELGFDFAWCRWVASFVSSPQRLIDNIAHALRRGGTAIFHEYSNYMTWQMAPVRPAIERFGREVMESWRASGGEPDVAVAFPPLLRAAGLSVIAVRPRVLTISPRDYAWRWPASFIEINLERLQGLGRIDAAWADSVRREWAEAEADPTSWFTTPMFLEIVARRADD